MRSDLNRALFLLFLSLASFLSPAEATVLTPVTERQLVKEAELIFRGVVTQVDYRLSSKPTKENARLPHTFVTFTIEQILKGKVSPPTSMITLRFLGGPHPKKRKRFLTVDECPLFDVGERGILFVRHNEQHICPIVGWAQGRFRIVAPDELFSDDGRELWLASSQGPLRVGMAHPLPEVLMHWRGTDVFTQRVFDTNQPEEPLPPPQPPPGSRLTATGFLSFISYLVSILHTPEELANLPPVKSANPDLPFSFKKPAAVGSGLDD